MSAQLLNQFFFGFRKRRPLKTSIISSYSFCSFCSLLLLLFTFYFCAFFKERQEFVRSRSPKGPSHGSCTLTTRLLRPFFELFEIISKKRLFPSISL